MFRNYLKTAWRTLLKSKLYAVINMAGLTVGLAVGILILLWVNDEYSFDGFHRKAADIYRMEVFGGTGASKQIWSMMVPAMGPLAKKELPQVIEQARLVRNYLHPIYEYQEKKFSDEHVEFADPSLFSMFDFPFVEGNPSRPFPDLHSVVITQQTAEKFFGKEPAMGRVITTPDSVNFVVSGVLRDLPRNSSIQFDMLMPMDQYIAFFSRWKIDVNLDFNRYVSMTFLELRPGASTAGMGVKLNRIHLRYSPQDTDADYLLLPLRKMHLYNADGSDAGAGTVKIFLIIGLLILIIACINYVNLSTARAMLRSKEVSMRKIVGAAKFQLFLQFVLETALMFLISALLSIVLVRLAIPLFNQVAGKTLVFGFWDGRMWAVIGWTILATLAGSSIYPALLLSSFDPLKTLRNRLSIGGGDAAFRKALVVLQFACSVGLIIGTLVIYRQLDYIRHKDLGYDKSHVLSFDLRNTRRAYATVKARLLALPGVQGVSGSSNSIIELGGLDGLTDWEGKPPNQSFTPHFVLVDENFFSFFKIPLAAGEGFTGRAADSSRLVLNEAAVKETGLVDPIGKRFRVDHFSGRVSGVVKDFHFGSMKKTIQSAVFVRPPNNFLSLMYVRTTGNSAAGTIRAAESLYRQYNPDYPFSYAFLDDSFNHLYQSEEREGVLFLYFAVIAIMISCLGLFALTAYDTQLRFREIGIRKVLGAGVPGIVTLLTKDFVRLVLLGIVIAVPVAWYVMADWLAAYAYRTDLSWTVFVVAGALTILIALLTISWQAMKAARANPVTSLKTE